MKNILGLDLGTASIGWAVVKEAENANEKSLINRIGVRTVPLTTNEKNDFESGKSITTNSERTQNRGMRRSLQRYKLRRQNLIDVLKKAGWITDDTILAERGNFTTFQTLYLRAKAAEEEISLEELARVLLMINKKRGYKSNRKLKDDNEGTAVDSLDVAKELYEKNITPGQYVLALIEQGKSRFPDFYKSDLEDEINRIWEKQKEFYPDVLTDDLRERLKGKNKAQTWGICRDAFGIVGIKRDVKGKELIKENYELRATAVTGCIGLEQLAIVLQEINSQLQVSNGYLGNISDRSKELRLAGITVGQRMVEQIKRNPNVSLKRQAYYRQDYMDEFERIWTTQSSYHAELTPELKSEIRDIVIFYQRPLKSQKGLVSVCELERKEIQIANEKGGMKTKVVGPKVCPKSSPLFQEFVMWQTINNLKVNGRYLEQEDKNKLAEALSVKAEMSDTAVLKLLYLNQKDLKLNHKKVPGNRTQAVLYEAYADILEAKGHITKAELMKRPYAEMVNIIEDVFMDLGYNTDILHFSSNPENGTVEEQPMFQLWHLLYSYQGDNSDSGNDALVRKISEKYGFEPEYAKIIAKVSFESDYGSLSSHAIKKILPYMKDGAEYSLACEYAGYRHSRRSLTKEELERKQYKDRLANIPKNSLRNPVVEKILNQMINVVNAAIDEYGRFDEIRIELARELKKSRDEREKAYKDINAASRANEKIKEKIQTEFGIPNPTRNDIIKYRLYEELASNGYKTLYSGTYIPQEKLFTQEFNVEHIIPKAKLFDDSFSNKTLEDADVNNREKSNMTALDFVRSKYGEAGLESYRARVEKLYKDKKIGEKKYRHLLMSESEIPDGFIARDLRDTQYIARKAKEILEEVVRSVVSTTGEVTARLREDWQLVDIMKELNFEKYRKQDLVEYVERNDRSVPKIKDWTKRNDHRHHAVDALTIAFTKLSYIQYLNYLNARVRGNADGQDVVDLRNYSTLDVPKSDRSRVISYIEATQMYVAGKGKRRFIPPMPLDEFRAEAKRQLENVLVSVKAKNKVVTRNTNKHKTASGIKSEVQLTPRGKLHDETIYGSIKRYVAKEERVGSGFTMEKIKTVAKASYREALAARLAQFDNDPKKAFCGKNSLEKTPLYVDDMHTAQVPLRVKTVTLETIYTVRKAITPINFKDEKSINKVIDKGVRGVSYPGLVSMAMMLTKHSPTLMIILYGLTRRREYR